MTPPKYNENRIICRRVVGPPNRIKRHFNCLDRKFITQQINEIFHRINEFEPPEQPNNNGISRGRNIAQSEGATRFSQTHLHRHGGEIQGQLWAKSGCSSTLDNAATGKARGRGRSMDTSRLLWLSLTVAGAAIRRPAGRLDIRGCGSHPACQPHVARDEDELHTPGQRGRNRDWHGDPLTSTAYKPV